MARNPGLLVCLLLVGCVITVRSLDVSSDEAPPAPAAPADLWKRIQGQTPASDLLVVGARVFDERCAVCHGDSGHGDGTLADVLGIRPRNYHADRFLWGSRPSQIVVTVANGRSGIMPPFREVLSEREMWAVAALVWRWIPEERRERDTADTMLDWRLPDPLTAGSD